MISLHHRPMLRSSVPDSNSSTAIQQETIEAEVPQMASACGPRLHIRMTASVHSQMLDTLAAGAFTKEEAGLLLGPRNTDIATHFVRDVHGEATPTSFTLHIQSLNDVIRRFAQVEIELKGIVHVHPPQCVRPSIGDRDYLNRMFTHGNNRPNGHFLFPIICDRKVNCFVVAWHGQAVIQSADLLLL